MGLINFHPQSDALELAETFTNPKLRAIANYGCCAFVALHIIGINGLVSNLKIIGNEIGKGLDDECTVLWYKFFENVSGKKIKIEYRDIKSLEELKDVEQCAVRFDYNGKSHWVYVSRGEITYNPLKYSLCVDKGRPATARIITFL